MSVTARLMEAIRAGDADAVGAVLESDPHAAQREGDESPLLTALYHGRRDLADLLVAGGWRADAFEAAALGQADALGPMLDADEGALTRYTPDGWTMLHFAAFFGHADTVALLLDRGADPHAVSRNAMANTPLHAALSGPLPPRGLRLLLEAGADPNARQQGGFVALHSAAQNGNLTAIDLLLAAGADVNAATDDGRTAIDMAREKGRDEAVAHLAARGADEGPEPIAD